MELQINRKSRLNNRDNQRQSKNLPRLQPSETINYEKAFSKPISPVWETRNKVYNSSTIRDSLGSKKSKSKHSRKSEIQRMSTSIKEERVRVRTRKSSLALESPTNECDLSKISMPSNA